ncbi:MAG: hypothetical protein KC620_18325, partial [Myxococcales bacterium]|nr:hypothetical protein [Myxococcales bacterium]
SDADHPLAHAERMHDTAIRDCEWEALAFEALGGHYLGDAWSMGHMWQRWGTPNFAPTIDGRVRAQLVAMVSGLEHGWRAVIEGDPAFFVAAADPFALATLPHDQLCFPGAMADTRLLPTAEYSVDEYEPPRWAYPGVAMQPIRGGGDMYLFPCRAKVVYPLVGGVQEQPLPAITTSAALRPHYARMMSCLTRGMAEVYAAGPQTIGPVDPLILDPAVDSSTSDLCWNQRATNRAMYLGLGISAWRDSRSPVVQTAFNAIPVRFFNFDERYGFGDVGVAANAASAQLQIELGQIAFSMTREALRNPNGTDVADMQWPQLASLLDRAPNGTYAQLIDRDLVAYLERADPTVWAASTEQECVNDSGCDPGHYCGRGMTEVAGLGRCVPYEASFLRALRRAEAPNWCRQTTLADIELAVRNCGNGSGGGGVCAACAERILPFLRNACDEASHRPTVPGPDDPSTGDHRSLCDVYQEAGLVPPEITPPAVYWPYDPNEPEALERAARALCEDWRPPDQPAQTDYMPVDTPPAEAEAIGPDPVSEEYGVCGSSTHTRWWRFQLPIGVTLRRFVARTTPLTDGLGQQHLAALEDIELSAFTGPDCDVPWPIEAERVEDELRLLIRKNTDEPLDFCVRVRTRDPELWSNVTLEHFEPPGCTLSSGTSSHCLRRPDGTLLCWGRNAGNTITPQHENVIPSPVVKPAPGPVRQIRLGPNFHHCLVTEAHVGYCWGYNSFAQLGTGVGTLNQNIVPNYQRVTVMADLIDLQPGNDFTCGLTGGGQVMCFGDNLSGELGRDLTPRGGCAVGWFPDPAPGCENNVRADAAPVLFNDGAGPLLPLDDVVQIAIGDFHGCALRADGGVYCWGANSNGELARPNLNFAVHALPVEMMTDAGPALLDDAIAISSGYQGSCAVRADGTVWCWGHLKTLLQPDVAEPDHFAVQVPGVSDAFKVTNRLDVGCAVDVYGFLWCFGANRSFAGVQFGGLGNGTGVDSPVGVLAEVFPVTDVEAEFTMLALTEDGRVWAWSANNYGNHASGFSDNAMHLLPAPTPVVCDGGAP